MILAHVVLGKNIKNVTAQGYKFYKLLTWITQKT